MVLVHPQCDLPDLVGTGTATDRLTGGLDSGQQEADENADDGNHDEQLDEGKPAMLFRGGLHQETP